MKQCLREDELWDYFLEQENGHVDLIKQKHISQCFSCKLHLKEIETNHREIQKLLESEHPESLSDLFDVKVMNEIRKKQKNSKQSKWKNKSLLVSGLAATVAIGLTISYSIFPYN